MSSICCIFNFPPHYRAPIYQLMDRELHPDFYFGDHVPGAPIRELNCNELHGFRGRFRNFAYHRKILWMSRILRLLFSSKYDTFILTVDSACLSQWLFLYIAPLLHKRTFLWTHGWYGNENRWARFRNLLFYKPATALLLYGDRARRLLLAQGLPERKLYVIANSLDYDRQLQIRQHLQPTDIYRRHFNNKLPTLIFIGRLTTVKRLDSIVRCVHNLHQRHLPVNAVLIGDGPEASPLQSLISSLQLTDYFWLPGACYDERINAEYIYNADICLSPGNVGLTAIHSLTYATPVITHDNLCRQMPEVEVITPGLTGDFFAEGSLDSMTSTVERWLRCHPAKTDKLRQDCYSIIDNRYNPHYQLRVLQEALATSK